MNKFPPSALFFLICLFLNAALASASGGDVGNGGDGIPCKASGDNFLNGMYSLDYVLTLPDAHADNDIAQVQSWEASAERIYTILKTKVPSLAEYFAEFRKSVFNTNDYTQTRIWEPAPFGLIDIKDENITSLVPPNCKDGSATKVVQAVIREHQSFSGTHGHIIYKFVPSVVDDLKQNNPLQLSFLIVHEWLWDISSNVDRNRRINRFLHSKKIETMDADAVIANLKGMGLFIPDVAPDVFEPTSCQGNRLTMEEVRSRYSGDFVLRNLGPVEFYSRARVVECSTQFPECSHVWMPSSADRYLFNKYPFFAMLAWQDGNVSEPLQIVSPDLLNYNNEHYRPGDGQLFCHFAAAADYNLECSMGDSSLVQPLTGGFGDDSPQSEWPKVHALLTDECLRLETRFKLDVSIGTPRGAGEEVHERQNILFVRYKWRN